MRIRRTRRRRCCTATPPHRPPPSRSECLRRRTSAVERGHGRCPTLRCPRQEGCPRHPHEAQRQHQHQHQLQLQHQHLRSNAMRCRCRRTCSETMSRQHLRVASGVALSRQLRANLPRQMSLQTSLPCGARSRRLVPSCWPPSKRVPRCLLARRPLVRIVARLASTLAAHPFGCMVRVLCGCGWRQIGVRWFWRRSLPGSVELRRR